MAHYIVGDIQGCLDELLALLDRVDFQPSQDKLFVAGDLVARGPNSLETLRYLHALGDAVQCVLGNHDLHLLAVHAGLRAAKPKDKLDTLLQAPDCEQLIQWLRQQPLACYGPDKAFLMSHAGIAPQWDCEQAIAYSNEVCEHLQALHYRDLLAQMYGNSPDLWHDDLSGYARLRAIINVFTRMRYVDAKGRLDFDCKQPPETLNHDSELQPWFEAKGQHLNGPTLIFGHWASLMGQSSQPKAIALDTGCVWGNYLTLLRWEDRQRFTQPSLGAGR